MNSFLMVHHNNVGYWLNNAKQTVIYLGGL